MENKTTYLRVSGYEGGGNCAPHFFTPVATHTHTHTHVNKPTRKSRKTSGENSGWGAGNGVFVLVLTRDLF